MLLSQRPVLDRPPQTTKKAYSVSITKILYFLINLLKTYIGDRLEKSGVLQFAKLKKIVSYCNDIKKRNFNYKFLEKLY